jgi:large subunit ribosomal protein L15
VASGWGKTAGRGSKGHKARSGGGVRPGFEGGQMPIHRRLPKRGFTNIFKKNIAIINIRDLAKFESGAVVDEAALIKAGLVKGRIDGVKLLAQGDIDYPLTISLPYISESAKAKITAAGGTVNSEQ